MLDKLNSDVMSIIIAYSGYFKYAKFLDKLSPGSKQKCYKAHLRKKIIQNETEYLLFNRIHRENDEPALIIEQDDDDEYNELTEDDVILLDVEDITNK